MKPLITSRTDWTPQLITEAYNEIEMIALDEMKLQPYQNQITIISSEQMLDAYSSVGMPVHYNHWSFGKDFLKNSQSYQQGRMGLAYEIVINSNPCEVYCMEDNDMTMQALVIAHAAFGHNHFFANNYLFKEWTQAGSIIDFMLFAKDYIRDCEERYGEKEVEMVLDAAHALAHHGVDKYKRKSKPKIIRTEEEDHEAKEKADMHRADDELDMVFRRTIPKKKRVKKTKLEIEPEENLLYFLEKHSNIPQWKKEILRIVRKINTYYYPQSQTKISNEGMATFTHYHIMNRLEEKGIISPDAMLSFLTSHTGVTYQPNFKKRWYSGANPYAIGFAVYRDIKRMCENPTKEDEEWFPNLVGKPWQEEIKTACANFRDDGFIQQYLSPKVIRDFGLFAVKFKPDVAPLVTEIHDEIGYSNIKNIFASTYSRVNYVPELAISAANLRGDRKLTIEYFPHEGRNLDNEYLNKTLKLMKVLWEYPIEIVTKTTKDSTGEMAIVQLGSIK